MRCPNCGSTGLPQGARFCPFCTQPLPPPLPAAGSAIDFSEAFKAAREFEGREWIWPRVNDWLKDAPPDARKIIEEFNQKVQR